MPMPTDASQAMAATIPRLFFVSLFTSFFGIGLLLWSMGFDADSMTWLWFKSGTTLRLTLYLIALAILYMGFVRWVVGVVGLGVAHSAVVRSALDWIGPRAMLRWVVVLYVLIQAGFLLLATTFVTTRAHWWFSVISEFGSLAPVFWVLSVFADYSAIAAVLDSWQQKTEKQ